MMALLVQQAEFRLGNQAPELTPHFHGLTADANVCMRVPVNWLLPIHRGKCSVFLEVKSFHPSVKIQKASSFCSELQHRIGGSGSLAERKPFL